MQDFTFLLIIIISIFTKLTNWLNYVKVYLIWYKVIKQMNIVKLFVEKRFIVLGNHHKIYEEFALKPE